MPAPCARRADELSDEERVAARALGQRLELELREREVARGGQRQQDGLLVLGKRAESRAACPPSTANGSPSGRRVTQTSHGRGWARPRCAQEEAGRVVDPVDVLDDDRASASAAPGHELRDDLVQLVAAERGVDLVGLRRRVHLGAERDGEQRQPRREVGHDRLDERRELRAGRLGGSCSGVIPASGRSSERTAKNACELSYASQRVFELLEPESRASCSSATRRDLPIPGSPTSSTSWNCRMRAASTACRSACELLFAADERQLLDRLSRGRPSARRPCRRRPAGPCP